MKYLYVALGILAVILGFCLTTTLLLDRYVDETSACLKSAQTHAEQGDFDSAAEQVQKAMGIWDKHQGLFGVILRHDEADEVSFSLHSLLAYAEISDADDFRAECAELIARIDHVSGLENPHYYNILSAFVRDGGS